MKGDICLVNKPFLKKIIFKGIKDVALFFVFNNIFYICC